SKLWIVGQIRNFVWIIFQIVKFLGRTFPETKFKEFFHLRFVAMIEDEILCDAAVAVAEWADGFPHFWIAGRPAVGTKVANVEKFLRANGARRIAGIAFSNVGVTFAFNENGVAIFL